jgi:DNA polymerase I-like protein with 3'-5' exonuclease and polymerase domains
MQKKICYLDIETNTQHNRIWCCCTLIEGENEVKVWTSPDEFLQFIVGVDIVVAHNGIGFDFPVLADCWGYSKEMRQHIDTLVLSRLANPIREQGHSLKSWGIKLGLHKGDFTDFDGGLTQEMIDYCKQDVLVLQRVYKTVTRELEGFSQASVDLEMRVSEIIEKQISNGFLVDVKMLMLFISDLESLLDTLRADLQNTFSPNIIQLKTKQRIVPFNPGSRRQIADRLVSLGWKPGKFTETGKPVVDEVVLSGVNIPEAQKIANFLLVQKRLAQAKSWMEALSDDDRVHGKVITIGAVTTRMTHSNPNMAQVPAARSPYGTTCRSIWTTPKGFRLVGADLSGIELRCFAHYLNDTGYINEIVNGDVHTRNQMLFGVATRDLAKTVLYAGLYGASPTKLAEIIGGSRKDGGRLREGFNKIPGYTNLVGKIDRMASAGWLPGLDGRRLMIRSSHAALNTLLQGAGAIIFKQWLVLIEEVLTGANIRYKIVASVHDEVQLEVEEERADEAGRLVVKAAEDAGVLLGFRCPVAAEYKVGKNWFDTH